MASKKEVGTSGCTEKCPHHLQHVSELFVSEICANENLRELEITPQIMWYWKSRLLVSEEIYENVWLIHRITNLILNSFNWQTSTNLQLNQDNKLSKKWARISLKVFVLSIWFLKKWNSGPFINFGIISDACMKCNTNSSIHRDATCTLSLYNSENEEEKNLENA